MSRLAPVLKTVISVYVFIISVGGSLIYIRVASLILMALFLKNIAYRKQDLLKIEINFTRDENISEDFLNTSMFQ